LPRVAQRGKRGALPGPGVRLPHARPRRAGDAPPPRRRGRAGRA